jgi:glycosyltransferase involved in cell wall biosynthesis
VWAWIKSARRLGLPCVYEIRGIWEDTAVADGNLAHGGAGYRYVRGREDVALRGADAVVAICESLAAEVRDRGAAPARTFVAPNGADLPRLDAATDRARASAAALRATLPAGDVLGYVGSVRPLEGVGELVEAVASMRAAGRAVVGVVVGDGPSLPALREQARRLGVADAVAFPGRVPPADVGAYYDLIDVFVVSRGSSRVTDLVTPIKPLEAMGRGKAVVMSNLPALRELGEPGDAARFYAAGSVSDLVAVAARLLDDRAARVELGARARAWVAHERTWSRSLDATLVAYDAAAQHAASR